VKSPLLFPTKAMQAETPSQKYAMRAQNQTIITDGNTIFYLNSGIDISCCAGAVSKNMVKVGEGFIQRIH
jgi:hypothetical protein